jgi:hypothetical protein
MTDPWSWWFDKLAGKPVQMNEGNPHAGFYRMPRKAFYGARKTFTPVAYWPGENGKMNCRFGDDDISWQRGEEIWKNVGNHPVSEQAYRDVAQFNKPWPDEHELVPMGDNLGPDLHGDAWDAIAEQGYIDPTNLDLIGALKDRVDDLSRETTKRLDGPAIADQDEADRLANLADALGQLHKIADGTRKQERKPHDEALKAIQLKWANVLLKAEIYRNLKFKLLTPWQIAQEKAQKEAAEAAAAGEPAAANARRPRAGTRGRAQTLKTFKHAEIEDYELTLAFFKESQDVKNLIGELANRAVRAGITVPGTKVIKEQRTV